MFRGHDSRWRRLLPLAVYTAITLVWFWRLWTPIPGAAQGFRYDPVHEYWADLIYQVDTLGQGELALWNPHDRGGFPIYGDPQPGFLYPGNWPLWLWGLAKGEVSSALMDVKVLAHWIFGLLGMHFFLRRRRLPEAACYLGAILFGFTEPAIRYGGNALNWSYAWLPWLLLAIDAFADRIDRKRAIVLGTTLAMTLLAGAPAAVLYAIVIGVPYGLARLRGRIRVAIGPVVVAAGVFLLWTLPLLLGNVEQVPHSVRDARDLEFITFSTFAPTQLAYVVLPRLGLYYGALAIFCAGVWMATRRGLALVVGGVFAAGIALSLGHHADVLGAMASLLPPFTLFRRAHRYLYIASVALSFAAAAGFAVIVRAEGERARRIGRWALLALGALVAVIGVGLVAGLATAKELVSARNDSFALAAVAALGAAFLVHQILATRGSARGVWTWATVVFVACDLWLAYAKIHAMGYGPKPDVSADSIALQLDGVADGRYRIYDRGVLQYRPGVRLGIRDFGGYEDDPLGLARYRVFKEAAARDPKLFGHANVRYVFDRRKPALPLRAPTARPLPEGGHELAAVSPRVMFVATPEVADDADDAMSKLRRITPGTGAVVEGEMPHGDTPAVVAGTVVEEAANRLVVRVDAPGPGVVVIAEAYYPRWTATVNGEAAPVAVANGMFRAVPVAHGGSLTVVMELSPTRYYATLPLFGVAMILFGWALVAMRREKPSRLLG